jgi:hypothetical protein
MAGDTELQLLLVATTLPKSRFAVMVDVLPSKSDLALSFAVASYYWVEKPFLAMRKRRKQKITEDRAQMGKMQVAREVERESIVRVA